MQAKTERFEMRLEHDVLGRIDQWRGRQSDVPSRAEAVRRLIDVGLMDQPGAHLALRSADRLILAMLCDTMKALKLGHETDPAFIEDALYGGELWALEWRYHHLLGAADTPKEVVDQVVDILDMWSFLQEGFAKVSKPDQRAILEEFSLGTGPLWFPGFDGNNEGTHLGVARFLVDKMDRFANFKGKLFNSHSQVLNSYLRMLPMFASIRPTLVGKGLSAKQITEILRARRYRD